MNTLSNTKNHDTSIPDNIPGYSIQSCIGSGTFAKVYVGTDNRTGSRVAIKKIILVTARTLDKVRAETETIKTFDHPNIVKCLDLVQMSTEEYIETTKSTNSIVTKETLKTRPSGYIVMEYCNAGTIDNVLMYQKKHNPVGRLITFATLSKNVKTREADAHYYMIQLRDALIYIQERGYMHRDIKPMNVLLQSPDTVAKSVASTDSIFGSFEIDEIADPKQKTNYSYKSGYTVKLADFGLSRHFKQETNGSSKSSPMLNTVCGSPLYMAPELLMNTGYTDTIDLWSYGIIMYEMLFGYRPTESSSITNLKKKLFTNDIDFHLNYGYSREAIDLLQRLLAKDRKNRITWPEFADHPWFRCWVRDPSGNLIYKADYSEPNSTFSVSVPEPSFDTLGVFFKRPHISDPLELPTSRKTRYKDRHTVEDPREYTNMSNLSIVKPVQQQNDIDRYVHRTPKRLKSSNSRYISDRSATKPIDIPRAEVSDRRVYRYSRYDNIHDSSSGTPISSPNKWSDPFASSNL